MSGVEVEIRNFPVIQELLRLCRDLMVQVPKENRAYFERRYSEICSSMVERDD